MHPGTGSVRAAPRPAAADGCEAAGVRVLGQPLQQMPLGSDENVDFFIPPLLQFFTSRLSQVAQLRLVDGRDPPHHVRLRLAELRDAPLLPRHL